MRARPKVELLLLSFAIASCAANRKPPLPPQPIGETHTTSAQANEEPPTPRDDTVPLIVTSRVRALCGLPAAPPIPSDYTFDGRQLRPDQGEDVLPLVATCMTAPRNADRRLCVSAYVDPLGGRDYERNLGHAHADAAIAYLQKLGVRRDRTTVAVRGGSDTAALRGAASRPLERRIEVDTFDAVTCTGQF